MKFLQMIHTLLRFEDNITKPKPFKYNCFWQGPFCVCLAQQVRKLREYTQLINVSKYWSATISWAH